MHIGHILNRKGATVVTLRTESPVTEAAELMNSRNVGAVVVEDATGVVAGLISERDIARGVALFGTRIFDMRVEDLMTREMVTCGRETSIRDILLLMSAHEIRHIPIVEAGRLAGIVSMRDVVDTRLGELETENESLRQMLSDAA